MFDLAVFQESVASRQRAAVNASVDKAIRTGTFTYTELLMADEPVRTMALEYLDGVTSEGGTSATKGEPIEIEPIRLVCINPNDSIKVSRWTQRRIVGTHIPGPSEKITELLGPDARVDDKLSTRVARGILRRHGWPIRNKNSRGANDGTIVEWKWLEREAKLSDADAKVKEIHADILAREAPAQASIKQTKSAGAQTSAHP